MWKCSNAALLWANTETGMPRPDRKPTGSSPGRWRWPRSWGWESWPWHKHLELAEQKFLEGSVALQTPHCLWSQLQVGDQSSVIGVVLEGEKPFRDFFGFQSHGSAHGQISVLCFPVERSVGKLGCLRTSGKIVVSSLNHAVLQRLVHSGNDGVAQPSCIERFDDLSVVESSIEPHPGAAGSNRRRKFLQDRLQEIPCARGGVHVACSEFHPQAQTALPSLEMIGA